jgi:hypothetical protein
MTQVIDGETLGAIWVGDITMWDDQRILDLNSPDVAAKLPSATIELGYDVSAKISQTQVFVAAMSSFSERFRAVMAAANGSMALLPPARAGNAFPAGNTSTIRLTWLQVHSCSVGVGARTDVHQLTACR